MSTPPPVPPATTPVAVTIIPLSQGAYAMQMDASLQSVPSVLTTDEKPQYLGQFSAEQERAILDMVAQTFKKPEPAVSNE